MSRIVEVLARRPFTVGAASAFGLKHPKSELKRLAAEGTILRLTHGFYVLVPESKRRLPMRWRPSIEGLALGVAAAMYTPDKVALVGPSAARALGGYHRPLNTAFVAVPKQRQPRTTPFGTIHFTTRDIFKLDITRVETDLGPGRATSPEQTAFDLVRNYPAWPISDAARAEMLQQLSNQIDWGHIDEIAANTRSVETLEQLRASLGEQDR